MNKTCNPINISIKEGARKILDTYNVSDNNKYISPFLKDLTEEQQCDPAFILRRISSWNELVNGQISDNKITGLKKIADKAGIDEDFSMHIARHSFAQYGVDGKEIPPLTK